MDLNKVSSALIAHTLLPLYLCVLFSFDVGLSLLGLLPLLLQSEKGAFHGSELVLLIMESIGDLRLQNQDFLDQLADLELGLIEAKCCLI